MTKKLKIPKIARYLFYGLVLFLYTNCSVEEELIVQNKDIIHKKLNFNQLKEDNSIMDNLTNYSKLMKQSNLNQKSSDSWVIDISLANYVETNEFISYTFNMPTTSVPLRNFLLKKQKNSTGGFHGYILNYKLTQEELNSSNTLELNNLSNKLSIIKIGNNFSPAMFGKSVYCPGTAGICYVGDPDGHIAYGSECIVSAIQFLQIPCPEDGGGVGTPDNPVFSPPPADNTGGGSNPVVIVPIKKNDNPNIAGQTINLSNEDCENLKNLFDLGKQNIKPIINQLKQKLNSKNEWGCSHKMGYVFDPIENTNTLVYSNTPIEEGVGGNISLPYGSQYPSATHTHPKSIVPMFAWQDLRALRNVYQECGELFKANVSIQIVCYNKLDPANPIVYSLKVKDFTKLNNEIEEEWDKSEYIGLNDKQKIDRINKKFGNDDDKNADDLELFFLQKFKDYGIDLYKANTQLSNWTKLELDINPQNPNGTLKQTPCL